ncbi:MAG: Trp family transcriptional regulator [Parcubacteria group bacterium]|jgi:Trp operon repressor
MAKVKSHEIDSKERYTIIGNFFDIIANLKSKKEVVDFFVGLLTPSENLMVARRIQIAQLLIEGEGYETIKNKLKVSFQTITKTERWLHSEDEDYNSWLAKCLKIKPLKNNREIGKENLLDRYSHHRVIKNLLK